MTTGTIRVSSLGLGMADALAATEKLGIEGDLTKKQTLHLRLMAEELFGMLRSIAGNVEADYWLDQDDKKYVLHLVSEMSLTKEIRDHLISVSSANKNAAARGFMGKLREMIEVALLPKDDGPSFLSNFSLGFMSMASASSPSAQQASADVFRWSLQQYKDSLDGKKGENDAAKEAWDELEKSIVASLADDVSVCVKGSHVELSIQKAF